MSKRKFRPEEVVEILRHCASPALQCDGCQAISDKGCCAAPNFNGLADIIEELLEQVRWIPVGERLPDLDDGAVLLDGELTAVKVLVAIEGAKRSTELYFDGEEFFDYTGDELIPYRVTHWRPMPEVPGEEGV